MAMTLLRGNPFQETLVSSDAAASPTAFPHGVWERYNPDKKQILIKLC